MRVTGGNLRGRRLRTARTGVRPTADRVREALFARLDLLDGARVLDLFAGSGALGIEAISRGAKEAVFVERAAGALEFLSGNLAELGLEARTRVLRSDAAAAVRRLGRRGERFDLLLIDPPYAYAELEPLIASILAVGLLAPGAVLVVERGKRHPVGPIEGLRLLDERRYGNTLVTRLVAAAPEPGGKNSNHG